MKKIIIIAISIILLLLGILAISICGIVFGAIDMAHGIYNAKSICFVVFGSLGVLIFGPLTAEI